MVRGDLCRGACAAALVALLSVVALAVPSHVARAEVNPDGSFSYTIPIEIPPGSNGVQPDLALVYNSNAGNGMFGVGWQLTGLPVITRMNWGEGINYNGLDTYTGPGGRLVPTGEFGPNGGRIYHTERESWARYEAILGCGAGGAEPCSWVMTDRDGNTRRFGDTADSFIDAVGKGGAARVWALSRFVSADGNYYSVTYFEDMIGGDYYPGTIQYGSGTHTLTIQFNLMTYPGQPIDYSQSARVHIDRILHSISIQDEGLEISHMEFSYSQSQRTNHQLLLDVVFRSNSTPAVSRTHTFTWNQGVPNLNQKVANTITPVGNNLDSANVDISRVKLGDYNGDGKTDLMRLNDWGGNGLANTVYFSNGDGSFSETSSNTEVYIGPDLGYARLDISRIKIGDFNGDGKTDFFRLNDAGASSVWDTMSIAVGNGHFWQTPSNTMTLVSPTVDWGTLDTSRVISGDFNGDGKTDLIRLNGVNSGGAEHGLVFARRWGV